MSIVNILKTVMKNNLKKEQGAPIEKTLVPLGAHQGSVIRLPDLDFALAATDGSICEMPIHDAAYVVTSIGKYKLWNMDVYHCYFGYDGKFLQLVTKENSQTVEQARYFHLRSEIQPVTNEDWEFWLGSWQKDENGEFIRDRDGLALKKEDGLIGYPQFQVDTTPPIVFNREWMSGNTSSVNPIKFTEAVVDVTGHTHYIKHEAMEYSRMLSANEPVRFESLLASVIEDTDRASINIFIGVTLDHTAIKVLVS